MIDRTFDFLTFNAKHFCQFLGMCLREETFSLQTTPYNEGIELVNVIFNLHYMSFYIKISVTITVSQQNFEILLREKNI